VPAKVGIPSCPITGKRSYRHRKQVLQAIAETQQMWPDVKLWPYKCDCGKWHMTKQSGPHKRGAAAGRTEDSSSPGTKPGDMA
jgi:hypothetical protein